MKRKDVTKNIQKLLRKWDNQGYSPMAINNGNCDIFAQEILDLCCNHGEIMWGDCVPKFFKTDIDTFGHCFFKFNGYYFDAECPEGVRFPDDLPYYKRAKEFQKVA